MWLLLSETSGLLLVSFHLLLFLPASAVWVGCCICECFVYFDLLISCKRNRLRRSLMAASMRSGRANAKRIPPDVPTIKFFPSDVNVRAVGYSAKRRGRPIGWKGRREEEGKAEEGVECWERGRVSGVEGSD